MKERKFIHVAAMTADSVIGNKNQLPWDIPGEMADFRAFTKGKTVVMGRKTYEGLGRYLPMRRNILLTRDPSKVQVGDLETLQEDGIWKCVGKKGEIEIFTSQEDVIQATQNDGDILILGGAEIYKLFMSDPRSILRISKIPGAYEGDTYFPAFEDRYKEYDREKKEGFDVVWYKKIDEMQ